MLESFISYLDASPASVRTYARAIRPFMKFVQENNITAPARKDVIRFRDVLLETRKASTVQLYMTAVRLFFQWAEDTGMYQDITRRVRVSKPNQGMHAKDCLTMNQCIDVLLAARKQESFMKGTRDFAMIYLMLAGGSEQLRSPGRTSRISGRGASIASCMFRARAGRTNANLSAYLPRLLRPSASTSGSAGQKKVSLCSQHAAIAKANRDA